jgi:hypothetical protein
LGVDGGFFMNSRIFLVAFALLFFALSAWAACSTPTLSISAADRFSLDLGLDVNLVFSVNPSPMTICQCPFGVDCGIVWQTDFNGSWEQIPQSTDQTIDLNCSGATCKTGAGFPVEDQVYRRNISCVDQNVFHIRGYHPYTATSSSVITVYCYPSVACTPPQTENFNLDTTCTYQTVPLLVDGNYNILANGNARHNESDINFFSGGTKYVNINNGGKLDLNKSVLFAGLSKDNFEIGIGVILFFCFATFIFHFFPHRWEVIA